MRDRQHQPAAATPAWATPEFRNQEADTELLRIDHIERNAEWKRPVLYTVEPAVPSARVTEFILVEREERQQVDDIVDADMVRRGMMSAHVLVPPIGRGDAVEHGQGEIGERAVDLVRAGHRTVRGIVAGHANTERAVGGDCERERSQPERIKDE